MSLRLTTWTKILFFKKKRSLFSNSFHYDYFYDDKKGQRVFFFLYQIRLTRGIIMLTWDDDDDGRALLQLDILFFW